MNIHSLSLDEDSEDLFIIGLQTNWPDYKVCFHLNYILGIQLSRNVDLLINNSLNESLRFSYFLYEDAFCMVQWKFISNRYNTFLPISNELDNLFSMEKISKNHYLIKELPKVDYFLIIKDAILWNPDWLNDIKSIPSVTYAYKIEEIEGKNLQNIIV